MHGGCATGLDGWVCGAGWRAGVGAVVDAPDGACGPGEGVVRLEADAADVVRGVDSPLTEPPLPPCRAENSPPGPSHAAITPTAMAVTNPPIHLAARRRSGLMRLALSGTHDSYRCDRPPTIVRSADVTHFSHYPDVRIHPSDHPNLSKEDGYGRSASLMTATRAASQQRIRSPCGHRRPEWHAERGQAAGVAGPRVVGIVPGAVHPPA